jgi:hypothetical protein
MPKTDFEVSGARAAIRTKVGSAAVLVTCVGVHFLLTQLHGTR